ncbi:MAG TPA: PQQ-binding-like beta-propeller repeat protein [Tepidisphaeraceae bacterium]|nr:PQQ-binding-like beta-propeller repeat protein [Tepidisphaeraceae bacterium]
MSQKSFAVAAFVSLAFAALSYTNAAPPVDWPSWHGPTLDAKSPDTGLLKQWPAEGPKQLWNLQGIGKGFSTVAIADGMIYTTGDSDDKILNLFALDLAGKVKWAVEFDKAWDVVPGARSTPTFDNGKLYVISGHGRIGCLDAKTGKQLWTRQMSDFGGKPHEWGYAESVLIQGNLALLTPGGKNCIVALDKNTGNTVWMSTGFEAPAHYGSILPITFENTPLLLAGTGGGLVCFDARTGKALWSNPWCKNNVANCPTPAYADGYVFWANGYGKGGICMKLKTVNGKVAADVAWTTKQMDCHHGGYIIHKGYIYGNHNAGWTCLDLKTGRQMWNERAVGKGSLTYADDMLYLFSEKDGLAGLAAFSPQGLQMKGTFQVQGEGPSWAHPVIIGGRLYLRYDTNLYCFDVKASN